MKKALIIMAIAAVLAVPVLVPLTSHAAEINDDPADVTQIGEDSNLRTGTVEEFAATIIRWLLGIVGIILVGLIVYGGVTYATAAGNEERAEQGKNILTYAIIGVVIVVIAWLLTDWVLSALFDETTV
ncbi:MAG: MMCAP2_0565 family pilin-like conjugal transfer protein [bacterium]